MDRLVPALDREDVFAEYIDTPVGLLLEYHNLGRDPDLYVKAQLLVGMCMDNRKRLEIPKNFAYIIRTGGADLRNCEFYVSFAVAVGGVGAIALIAHNECGMVNTAAKKEKFISGLIRQAGFERKEAERYFAEFAPKHDVGNEIDFVISESKRLSKKYPNTLVAPIYYNVSDNLLYQIRAD